MTTDGDFTQRARTEPAWTPQRHASKPVNEGHVPSQIRNIPFLYRDLSEEGLSQPVEKLFTQRELAAKREEGVADGYEAGVKAATTSQAASRMTAELEALRMIAEAMEEGCRRTEVAADAAAAALAKALVACMQAVMPNLIERSALNEAGAMLAHCLPGLSREPAVRIDVPEEIAGYIEARLDSLAPAFRDKLSVCHEKNMAHGEVRVRWRSGEARRRPDQVWQDVMEALQPALDDFEPKDSHHGE